MKFSKMVLVLIGICLILAQSAFAVRLGGGRSYGMQRSYSHQTYSQSRNYTSPGTAQQSINTTQQPQRTGMGAGAAGAAGGYMLGRSMSNNNGYESNQQQQQAVPASNNMSEFGSHIPWGIISILGIFLIFGLMFFRKAKPNPGFLGNTNSGQTTGNPFSFFSNNQNNMMQNRAPQSAPIAANQAQIITMPMDSMDKMPDGVESIYFLRQVKGMFLHLQSMNSADDVNEIAKYMTPDLYQEMKGVISSNSAIADFTNLDCQLLSCEMSGTQLIASVKFFGSVSEDPTKASVPFSEIWNFIKTDLNTGKWVIAGIQQETKN
jgi:predicted lipid-binding transport protein (Tim44 family)